MTLREMIEQHPEWADLPIAVIDTVGDLHYIDGSGAAFTGEDFPDDADDYTEGTGDQVLVFTAN